MLITGASGFVGSALMGLLVTKAWDILPLVRRKYGLQDEVIIDLCDSDISSKLNGLPEVDTVVHLGAQVDFKASVEDLYAPNVFATECLARWASKINAHFIFASTAIVCGAKATLITPASETDADTDYGSSKLLAEEKIKSLPVRHAILRIGGVFGKDGPEHLGLNRAISRAMTGNAPTQYGRGEIKRNYIYVKDLAGVIYYCMENQIEGTHLVAGTRASSMGEMLQAICDVFLPEGNIIKTGTESGGDQLIENSEKLPGGKTFQEALLDIKRCE